MASVNSPIRNFVKPLLFKLLSKKAYKWFQFKAKLKDIENKLVEEPEMFLLPKLIQPNDEVLDIGANFAYFTDRFSGIASKGHVYAFEPIPFTYSVADMIIKNRQLKNVSLYSKGVGNKNEKIEFSVPKTSAGPMSAGQAHISSRDDKHVKGTNYYISDQYEKFDCEIITIDSFLPNLKNLGFIKIDIEGAEFFALQGMKNTIEKFKPIILIEIVPIFLKAFNIDIVQLQDLIQKNFEYEIYELNESTKKLNKVIGIITKDKNYILVHPTKNSFLTSDIYE